jgi:3D (Asp-Asp-Asp) domain-containing protein
VIAVTVCLAVAVIIPITNSGASAPSASDASIGTSGSVAEGLGVQAAGVTTALSWIDSDARGVPAVAQPPLGAGLFPEPLLSEAARQVVRDAFGNPERRRALAMARPEAISFTVHEDGFRASYRSKQITVGDALAEQGVRFGASDIVVPPLNSELVAGTHVYVRHALDVRLIVAGTQEALKTHGRTVGDVLAQAGLGLQPLDRVTPRANGLVKPGMTIKVTTVREFTEATEDPIQYLSFIRYDGELPKGQEIITTGGMPGSIRREYQVRLVNGHAVRRDLVSETITPATDEIVTVGTYVRPAAPVAVAAAVAPPAPVPATAPSEGMTCSRSLRVYATWYTAASSGGSGVTSTGTGVYKGIVAVDPAVIPLGTRMYIPGYGYGTAADTGGGIRGNFIDLGYGADDPKDWRTRWVDICIF